MDALPHDELRRRLVAARDLRGLSQTDLGDRLVAEGLERHAVARIERGERTLTQAILRALVDILEMPDWWFTADRIDLDGQPDSGRAIELLEEILAEQKSLRADLRVAERPPADSPQQAFQHLREGDERQQQDPPQTERKTGRTQSQAARASERRRGKQ